MDLFRGIKQSLDVGGSLACLVICGILVVGMVGKYRSAGERAAVAGAQAQVSAGLEIGEHFPRISNVDYKKHKQSIVLFLDSRCTYCVQSVPAYQSLQAAVDKRPGTHIALIGAFKSSSDFDHFKTIGFSIPSKTNVTFADYRVRATPTLVVVNQDGRIENFWVGVLPASTLRTLTQLIEETN